MKPREKARKRGDPGTKGAWMPSAQWCPGWDSDTLPLGPGQSSLVHKALLILTMALEADIPGSRLSRQGGGC